MEPARLKERLLEGALTRRELIRALAAAGIGVVSLPLSLRRAAFAQAQQQLPQDQPVYFGLDDYMTEEAARNIFAGYAAQHGGLPAMQDFAAPEQALNRLRGGFRADIAHPRSSDVRRWQAAGVLQPIDAGGLSHWPDVFDILKRLPETEIDGKRYFVPLDWGSSGIVHRADLLKITEPSYALLWDERYKGKLAVSNDASETVPMTALLTGAYDPFNLTEEELPTIREKLLAQKPLLYFYWNGGLELADALKAGRVFAAQGWRSTAYALRKQGVEVAFLNPREGAFVYCRGLVLLEGAAHIDAAYALIDALLAPEAGAALMLALGNGHANAKSFAALPADSRDALQLPDDPAGFLAAGILGLPIDQESRYHALMWDVKITP